VPVTSTAQGLSLEQILPQSAPRMQSLCPEKLKLEEGLFLYVLTVFSGDFPPNRYAPCIMPAFLTSPRHCAIIADVFWDVVPLSQSYVTARGDVSGTHKGHRQS